MNETTKFSCNHLSESKFKRDGLRPFFEYRDLGIQDATNGAVVAHVIRAVPGEHPVPRRHHHDVSFQMVYILKGWAEFEYEGVGRKRLTAGTCVHQPPGIVHKEVAHSDDLELIEIVMPGNFETHES
ncbi:MAG: cupin domain-containing protein [Burkholderiales bacterium]|nr:cupin domain-containing protein [Burkholderiales bacterium]OUT76346.1 MAG: cupin [Betaproteobacteria bacterium TMED22]